MHLFRFSSLINSVQLTSVLSQSFNPMDCSSPGSSVRGVLQARMLEWVAMPSSRGSSQEEPQDLGFDSWVRKIP